MVPAEVDFDDARLRVGHFRALEQVQSRFLRIRAQFHHWRQLGDRLYYLVPTTMSAQNHEEMPSRVPKFLMLGN